MPKLRVYNLARELNLDNAEIIRELQHMGVPVTSHSNTVDDRQAELLRKKLGPAAKPDVIKASTPVEAKAERAPEVPVATESKAAPTEIKEATPVEPKIEARPEPKIETKSEPVVPPVVHAATPEIKPAPAAPPPVKEAALTPP